MINNGLNDVTTEGLSAKEAALHFDVCFISISYWDQQGKVRMVTTLY